MSVTANWTGTCLNLDGSYWAQTLFNGTIDKNGLISSAPVDVPTCAHETDLSMDFNLTASKIKPWEIATLLANLTQSDSAMKQAYCLNPSPDDNCSTWDLCPQPDISGPMVTFAALITHFGLSVLLWLGQDIVAAFWSHMFTITALITTTFISTASGQLARSHAFAAGMLVASPPTLYIWFCAVRACIKGAQPTRLDDIVGHLLGRCVALVSMIAWFVLAGLVGSPSDGTIFSQRRCEGEDFLHDTLGVDRLSYVLWGALLASFALPWVVSRWYHRAKSSHGTTVLLADRLAAPWMSVHPLAQFGLLALAPTAALALLFKYPIQNLAKIHQFKSAWEAWPPLAFLVYTWVPLFFWTLVAFWRRYIAWSPADRLLSTIWNSLPLVVHFAVVVGVPSGAWLCVVIPNMVNPTGVWVSYGQLLSLFATLPVFVGVGRALFVARIEPWLVSRRGVVALTDHEELPRPSEGSATDSKVDPPRFRSAPGSSPLTRFENDSAGQFADVQMLERHSFQDDIGLPDMPYSSGGFNRARHSPAV